MHLVSKALRMERRSGCRQELRWRLFAAVMTSLSLCEEMLLISNADAMRRERNASTWPRAERNTLESRTGQSSARHRGERVRALRLVLSTAAMSAFDSLRQRGKSFEQFVNQLAANQVSQNKSNSATSGSASLLYVAIVFERLERVCSVFFNIIGSIWQLLQAYDALELLVVAYGLMLVFFGGVFITLIASIEAVHQFGWQRIKASLIALYNECKVARRALQRDDKLDRNHDGIADVKQLDYSELAVRRFVVLTAAINPDNVSAALEGLSIAAVAIVATLRVRFAKAITLGSAIGDVAHGMFSPFTTVMLQYALPTEYEKWIGVLNKYGFRYLGISVSWMLVRAVSSVFAAMKGSALVMHALATYGVRRRFVGAKTVQDMNAAVIAAWAVLTCMGLYFQISGAFALRFPWNVLLLPLSVAERAVVFVVGSSAQ